MHEADLALEQDLGHDLVLGITYMSSLRPRARQRQRCERQSRELAPYVNLHRQQHVPSRPRHQRIPSCLTAANRRRCLASTQREGADVSWNAATTRKYYRILRIASNVNSNYNALAFQINKRYRNGFSLLSNFTWSHALDFNPYIGTGIPGPSQLDPNCIRARTTATARSTFVAASSWPSPTSRRPTSTVRRTTLLGGWRIAPILQVQNGLPYTPFVSGYPGESLSGVRSANGAGGTSGRIDAIRRNQYTSPQNR